MPEVIEKYNLYDIGFDKFLSRKSYFDSDEYQEESSSLNSIFNATSPSLIGSGELIGNITMVNGLLQSSNFVTTVSGWKINYDGDVEFNEGTFRGALIAGSIHIPDENTTANSFHTNSTGNSWWGCTVDDFATDNNNANAYILNTGVAKFQNIILSSNVIISGIKAGSEIAIQNWSHNMVFSATDNDTVAWSAGSIKLLDGTIFSITAGNTGDITSITFIYLDVNTSETVLQITTTYSTAIGSNKILVCTCQNVAADKKAIFQVFSGKSLGGSSKLWTADDIAANSITANLVGTNEIIANTANIANAVISDAKITGTITVSHTDAKCTDADADQTSANQAATIASQGDLATTNEADANVLNMTNAPAAANADVTKTIIDGGLITTGYITLNTAGHIKSGQTAYGIGTGFWLGNDSGTPKFSIGDTTHYMKWTGTDLNVLGGTITGGTIQTASGTGERIVLDSSNDSLTFYNSSNKIVTQLGGGDDATRALRVNLDASTTEGVRVFAAQAYDAGFVFDCDGNYKTSSFSALLSGATNSGTGFYVNHKGSSGRGINVDVSNGAAGITLYNDGNAKSLYIYHTNDSAKAIDIIYAGRQEALYISGDDANSAKPLIYATTNNSNTGGYTAQFNRTGDSEVVAITQSCTSGSNAIGLKINIANTGLGIEYAFQFAGSEYIAGATGVSGLTGVIKVLTSDGLGYIPVYDTYSTA